MQRMLRGSAPAGPRRATNRRTTAANCSCVGLRHHRAMALPHVVIVGAERIEAKTVLWAAGVASSPLGRSLGAPLDRAGRVKVEPDLSVPGHPEVFVVGDLAAVEGVPGIAPAAKQMGRH